MASYIPYYGKKRARLAECERELGVLLRSDPDAKTLATGIESLRAAYIRVLKARRGRLAPNEKNAKAFANLDAQIDQWQRMTPEGVMGWFRKRTLAPGS